MASSKSVVIAALIANGLIAITKFIGYLLTGSPSMLSETYHSISDTGNQILLLTGIKYGTTQATEDHPFGKGKSQFFYSLLVSVFLFGIAGIQSTKHGYHAIQKALQGGEHSETTDVIIQGINLTELIPLEAFWINIGVLLAAFIFEIYALHKANQGINAIQERQGYNGLIETFKKTTNTTTLTAFTEDTVALIGIILALIGITATKILGNPLYDAATSFIIGLLLMGVAIALAWENKRLLLGESMEEADRQNVLDNINSFDQVNNVQDLKTTYFGPKKVLVVARVEFQDNLNVDELETLSDQIEEKLTNLDHDIKTVYIEAHGKETKNPKQ